MKGSKATVWMGWVLGLAVIAPILGFGQQAAPAGLAMRVLKDIPYYTGAGADPKFHSLDLYLPEGKSRGPLVLFVHGGGWRAGDKSMEGLDTFVELWLNQGIGVAAVNYRLSPAFKHPAHIQDVARALAWLRANAGQYGWDADNIFVVGHSAGAHLAALLALDPKYLEEQKLTPKAIRGVIAISGLYDLVELYEAGISPTRVELSFPMDRDVLHDASPAWQVAKKRANTPPLLIAYSDNDMFGLDEQAKSFYALLLENNLPVQLIKVANRTHSGSLQGISKAVPYNDSLGRTVQPVEDLLGPAMTRFVKRAQDGSFVRTFHAVWTAGGPLAVPKAPPPAVREILNVPYYSGPGADPKLNALDLLLPEGKTNFPLLFYVHGGSWRGGDKETPKALAQLFGRVGWGIASANYRLSPAVKHPTHMQDVARAFAWVYKNAGEYGIDRNRIVVLGHSAGGHLMALLALDPRYLEQEGVPAKAIKGAMVTSGMYDVPKWYEPGRVPVRREAAFGSVPGMEEASPIRLVNPQAPPFLITYTDRDAFMMPQQAHWFYSALLKNGLRARLVQVIDRTHQEYLHRVAQPYPAPTNVAADVLGMELVGFATEVAGPTPELSITSATR